MREICKEYDKMDLNHDNDTLLKSVYLTGAFTASFHLLYVKLYLDHSKIFIENME